MFDPLHWMVVVLFFQKLYSIWRKLLDKYRAATTTFFFGAETWNQHFQIISSGSLVYCTALLLLRKVPCGYARNAWNRSLPSYPHVFGSPRRGWTTSGPLMARIPILQRGNTPGDAGCKEDTTVNMFFHLNYMQNHFKAILHPFFKVSNSLKSSGSFSNFSQSSSSGKLVRMDSDRSKCLSVSWEPS